MKLHRRIKLAKGLSLAFKALTNYNKKLQKCAQIVHTLIHRVYFFHTVTKYIS